MSLGDIRQRPHVVLIPLVFVRPVVTWITDLGNHAGLIENTDPLLQTRGWSSHWLTRHLLGGHLDDAVERASVSRLDDGHQVFLGDDRARIEDVLKNVVEVRTLRAGEPTNDVRWTIHHPEMHARQILADDADGEELRAGKYGNDRRQERKPGDGAALDQIPADDVREDQDPE